MPAGRDIPPVAAGAYHLDMESAPPDPADRFAALHAESLELLDKTRSLVGELRGLLDDCKQRRPRVATAAGAETQGKKASPAVRSHRGARIGKTRRRRMRRRPR